MRKGRFAIHNRILSGILSAAMLLNSNALLLNTSGTTNGETKTYTYNGTLYTITYNEAEGVWETEQNNTNQSTQFLSYTFSAYWNPTERTLDYEWNAYKDSGKNSQEAKIVFEFSSTDTTMTWQGVEEGANSSVITSVTDGDYSEASDVWFVIPGIADANREEPQEAIVGNSSRYFYCDGLDVNRYLDDGTENPYFNKAIYYLNNNTQKLNGGMTIVWDYDPRDITNGYGYTAESVSAAEASSSNRAALSVDNALEWDESKSLHPMVYVKVYEDETGEKLYKKGTGAEGENVDGDGNLLDENGEKIPDPIVVKVQLPTMHFGFISEKDNVELKVNYVEGENGEKDVTKSIGIEDSLDASSLDSNFTWKRLSTNLDIYAKTRPLDDTQLYIEISAADVAAFNKTTVNNSNTNNVYLSVGGVAHDLSTLTPEPDQNGNPVYRIPVDENSLLKWSQDSGRVAKDYQNNEYSNSRDISVYLGVRNKTIEDLVADVKADAYTKGNLTADGIKSQAEIDAMPTDTDAEKAAKSAAQKNYDDAVNAYLLSQLPTDLQNLYQSNVDQNTSYAYSLLYGLTINIASHLERNYEDEDDWITGSIPASEMGTINNTFNDDPYDATMFYFGSRPSYEGDVGIQKTLRGVGSHYQPVYSVNYLKGKSQSNLIEYAVKAAAENIHTDGFTLHFGDDKMAVLRDADEHNYNYYYDYRLLKPSEYRLSKVTMPKYTPVIDVDGNTTSFGYTLHLYRYNSAAMTYDWVRDITGYDTSSEQIFNVYDDEVHKIDVEMVSNGQSITYTAYFGYTFDLETEGEDAARSGQTKVAEWKDNVLQTDPYGRLVNYSYMYTQYMDDKGTEDTSDDETIYNGISEDRIKAYKVPNYTGNLDSYLGLYDHYKTSNKTYLGFNYAETADSDYNELPTDKLADNVYVARSADDFLIKDPEISTWTKTDYTRDPNNALINLETYSKDGEKLELDDVKVAGTYYTELTSTVSFKADDAAALTQVVIKTILPKELASENVADGKYKTNSVNAKSSEVNGFSLQTPNGTYSLSTIQQIEAYCSSTRKGEYVDIPGTDYCYFVEELTLADGVSLQMMKDTEASISITYPLVMSFSHEASWKSGGQGTAPFYGITTVDAVTSSTSLLIHGASESQYLKNPIIPEITDTIVKDDIGDDDAASQSASKLPATAESWLENAVKTVTSDVYGTLDSEGFYAVANPYDGTETPRYAYYSYQLMYSMGNEYATRLYFYDNLEDAKTMSVLDSNIKGSQWRGTLQSVNIDGSSVTTETNIGSSTATKNGTILKATAYYNQNEFASSFYTDYYADNGADTSDGTPEGDGWYTEEAFKTQYNVDNLESARAVCVVVEAVSADDGSTSQLIARGQDVYFTIHMKAPVKTSGAGDGTIDDGLGKADSVKSAKEVLDTETYNNFTVRYARLDSTGNRDSYFASTHENEPANSDYTTVTLKDSLLKVNLVKTDGDRALGITNAATVYLPIPGAEFWLYEEAENTADYDADSDYWKLDGSTYYRAVANKASAYKNNGKIDYRYEYTTDISGELTLSLSPRKYILREITVPDGYKSIGDVYFTVEKDDDAMTAPDSDGSVIFKRPVITKIISKDGTVTSYSQASNQKLGANGEISQETYQRDLRTLLLFGELDKNTVGDYLIPLEFTNIEKPGQVTLLKYDSTFKTVFSQYGETVAEAEYQLFTSAGDPVYFVVGTGENKGFYMYDATGTTVNSAAAREIMTNAEGKLNVRGLPWGNYYFKEIEAPAGYVLNEEKINFSVGVNGTQYILNENEEGYSAEYLVRRDPLIATDEEENVSIVLYKYDDNQTDPQPVDGAEFTLYVWENNSWTTSSRYSGVSSYNGKVTFRNPEKGISKIALGGTYKITEVKANDSYLMPADPDSLEFKFSVPSVDGLTGTVADSPDADGFYVTTYLTSNGTILDYSLTSGGDAFKRVQTITEGGKSVTITANVNDNSVTAEVTMTNERKPAELTIFKTDDDDRALANASFALYEVVGERDNITDSNGTPWFVYSSTGGVQHTAKDADDTLDTEILARGSTNSNGMLAISKQGNFDWDTEYYLIETSSASDHELPTAPIYFTLRGLLEGTDPVLSLTQTNSDDNTVKLQLNVLNEKKLGTVTLRKYQGDESGDKVPATSSSELQYPAYDGTFGYKLQADAKFKLVDSKGNTVINAYADGEEPIKVNGVAWDKGTGLENLTTVWSVDDNGDPLEEPVDRGYLTIENLRWSADGDYYRFIETSAPDGFETAEIKKFTIGTNHTEVEKEVIDPIKTATLTVQKQIDEWNPAFGDASFIFRVQQVKDSAGNVVENQPVYTKIITFDGSSGELIGEAKFYNLNENATYQITEMPVARYVLDKIEAVGSENGTSVLTSEALYNSAISYTSAYAEYYTHLVKSNYETRTCQVTLIHEPKTDEDEYKAGQVYNTVRFTNTLKYYDKFSQNATARNELEKSVMVTNLYFNVNGDLLNGDNCIEQTDLADDWYDLFPTTTDNGGNTILAPMTDENGDILTDADGNAIYPSDALEVYITFDDETMEPVRIYPQGHPLYDENIGYYVLENHVVTGDSNVTYVENGRVYYLTSPRDEELKITVYPNTSADGTYSWMTSKRSDTEFVHVQTAPLPKDVVFKFYAFEEGSTDSTIILGGDSYKPGDYQAAGKGKQDIAYTITYTYDLENGGYKLKSGALGTPTVKAGNAENVKYFRFGGTWYDPSGDPAYTSDLIKNYMYDTVNNKWKYGYDAETEFVFYPTYLEGRAKFYNVGTNRTSNANSWNIFFRNNTVTDIVQEGNPPFEIAPSDYNKTDVTGILSDTTSLTVYNISVTKGNGSNGDEKKYTLPIWAWITEENGKKITHWYSEDECPLAPVNMSDAFKNVDASLKNISGLKNWDMSFTESWKETFQNCTSLEDISPILSSDSGWCNNSSTTMWSMFLGCNNLGKDQTLIDFSNWNTSKVKAYHQCFQDCWNLPSLNIKISSTTTDLQLMFNKCRSLDSATVTGDFSKVENMQEMFFGCYSTTNIDFGKYVDLSSLTTIQKIFDSCVEENGNTSKRYLSADTFRETFRYWHMGSNTLFTNPEILTAKGDGQKFCIMPWNTNAIWGKTDTGYTFTDENGKTVTMAKWEFVDGDGYVYELIKGGNSADNNQYYLHKKDPQP